MYNYRKYDSPKIFLKRCLKRFPVIILGSLIYIRLMSKDKHTYYLVSNGGMGDVLCELAYLGGYKRKNNIEHIAALTASGSIGQLANFYPTEVSDIIQLRNWQTASLNEFACTTYVGQYLITFVHRTRITFTRLYSLLPKRLFFLNDALSLSGFIKVLVYQIGSDAKPMPPQVPDSNIDGFITKYNIKKGHTVFQYRSKLNSTRHLRAVCETRHFYKRTWISSSDFLCQ